MYRKPELSVVILCYRAADSTSEFVPHTLKVLKEAKIPNFELVLVANYLKDSNDTTPEIVARIASKYKKVRYIAKEKKGMLGWDVRSGLTMAKGKYIALIDGDGQMPVKDIVRVYKKIKEDNLDIVKTFRTKRGDSLWRKIISYFFNVIFKIFFLGFYSRDVNSKPKIMTREAYKKMNLSSDDWFIDAEIMIQARRNKMKIGEIPTVFLGLTGRRSFVSLGTVWEFIVNLIRYRLKEFNHEDIYNRGKRSNRPKTTK